MDGARVNPTRRFPGYTTAELGLSLLKHKEGRVTLPKKLREEIEAEIKARETGKSVIFKTPQL